MTGDKSLADGPQVLPWQLRMFQKTLKKKLRLKALKKLLGEPGQQQRCLLVTCGDNNGAMNYYLRQIGGRWSWADMEDTSIAEMSELLGDTVALVQADRLPFPDRYFDHVVSIDVHEHLQEARTFTLELQRVTRDDGRVLITVPGGDRTKLINRLKERLGMHKENYGHVRDGYSVPEISSFMQESGIIQERAGSFSKFFTELLELGINLLYVKVLAKKKSNSVKPGTIAPQTAQQLKSIEKTYRIYSLIYPFFWLISQFDRLLFFAEGYVVIVEGRKLLQSQDLEAD